MKLPSAALLAAFAVLSTACDREAPTRPPVVPPEELPASDIPEVDDKTDRLPGPAAESAKPEEAPAAAPSSTPSSTPSSAPSSAPASTPAPVPSMLALPEGEKWSDMSGEAQSDPAIIAGRYSDANVPNLVYEFNPDGTWQATWDPGDGKNGLRMQGTFKVEYGLARLLLESIIRKDLLSGEFKRPRSMPSPYPRCLFRVEKDRLVMMGEMADTPFVTDPFTATDLVRQAP